MHGGRPRNKYEAQIQIKIIELKLRELQFSGDEIDNLEYSEMRQYLEIDQMKVEIQNKN